MRAAYNGHFNVVRWLAEHGADFKLADKVCLAVCKRRNKTLLVILMWQQKEI